MAHELKMLLITHDPGHLAGPVHLPLLLVGDDLGAPLVLDLPEDLVQVQLLVREDGHLELALGGPVPVGQQRLEPLPGQALQQRQRLLHSWFERPGVMGCVPVGS